MERKLPVKVETIHLNGEYTGFDFQCRTNPPWGLFMDKLTALEQSDLRDADGTLDRLYDILEAVATGWNFVDEKGKEIPFTRKGFRHVPLDLLHLIIKNAREAIEKVPLASSAE